MEKLKSMFFLWLEKLKKYKVELSLLVLAAIAASISAFMYFKTPTEPPNRPKKIEFMAAENDIYIEVSGEVKKPGVYKMHAFDRLKDALDKAGGLSENADPIFFAQNFNLARKLSDQDKFYIPSVQQVASGQTNQPQAQLSSASSVPDTSSTLSKIDINSATLEELDTLSGIGQTTAQKIIDNRPYTAVEDLLNKKIVKKNVYENIKNDIEAD